MTKQIQAGRKLESSWFLLGVTSTVLKQIGGKLMKTAGGLPFLGLFIFFRGRFEEIWNPVLPRDFGRLELAAKGTPNAVDPDEFCFKRSQHFLVHQIGAFLAISVEQKDVFQKFRLFLRVLDLCFFVWWLTVWWISMDTKNHQQFGFGRLFGTFFPGHHFSSGQIFSELFLVEVERWKPDPEGPSHVTISAWGNVGNWQLIRSWK